MDPFTIYAGAQAVGSGLKYFLNRKKRTPDFAMTDYGKYLQKLAKQGKYSPEAISKIMSGTGAEIGNVISTEVASRKGALYNKGMIKSIAGQKFLAEPKLSMARQLGETKRGLLTENELSKLSAEERYNMMRYQTDEQRRMEKQQQTGELIGGLMEAGGTYLKGRQYGREMAFKEEELTQETAFKTAEHLLKEENNIIENKKLSLEEKKNNLLDLHQRRLEGIEKERINIVKNRNLDIKAKEDALQKIAESRLEEDTAHNKALEKIGEINARKITGIMQLMTPKQVQSYIQNLIDKRQMPAQWYLLSQKQQKIYLDNWSKGGGLSGFQNFLNEFNDENDTTTEGKKLGL